MHTRNRFSLTLPSQRDGAIAREDEDGESVCVEDTHSRGQQFPSGLLGGNKGPSSAARAAETVGRAGEKNDRHEVAPTQDDRGGESQRQVGLGQVQRQPFHTGALKLRGRFMQPAEMMKNCATVRLREEQSEPLSEHSGIRT